MDSIERAARKLAEEKDKERRANNSARQVPPSASQPSAASPVQPPKVGQRAKTRAKSPPPGGKTKTLRVEIDIARLGRQGLVSPHLPVTRVAEEFRVLKHRLLHNIAEGKAAGRKLPNLIMVTSTQPREGKSFTAINLALSIASERDTHVLLIDGDFSNPSIWRLFNIKRPPLGFLDAVRDPELGLEKVVYKSNIESLSLIDAGRPNALSSEFLSSHRMRDLCHEIAERYRDRIVIFDSSPILSTSEASILSHNMGQVLYVVEARRTSQSAVQTGLELIHDKSKVMMVLNKSHLLGSMEAFGGYYKYDRNTKVG